MNQHFLEQIVQELKKGLSRIITDREDNIVCTPEDLPVSGILVRAGDLVINPAVQDDALESPHPVAFKEEFRVMKNKSVGPYQLELSPINDRFECTLIYHPSKNVEEEKTLIYERDFSINKKNQVEFKQTIANASLFYIDYEVSGTSTSSNFCQDIFLDIYDEDVMTAEKYASLGVSILLTNQSLLREEFNTLKTGEYGGKRYQSIHRLTSLRWISSKPTNGKNNHRLTLQFQVDGYIQHIRIIEGGIEVIKEVPVLLKEPV